MTTSFGLKCENLQVTKKNFELMKTSEMINGCQIVTPVGKFLILPRLNLIFAIRAKAFTPVKISHSDIKMANNSDVEESPCCDCKTLLPLRPSIQKCAKRISELEEVEEEMGTVVARSLRRIDHLERELKELRSQLTRVHLAAGGGVGHGAGRRGAFQ